MKILNVDRTTFVRAAQMGDLTLCLRSAARAERRALPVGELTTFEAQPVLKRAIGFPNTTSQLPINDVPYAEGGRQIWKSALQVIE